MDFITDKKIEASKEEALKIIGENISLENLRILAKAAKKEGINKKIQQYKNLL